MFMVRCITFCFSRYFFFVSSGKKKLILLFSHSYFLSSVLRSAVCRIRRKSISEESATYKVRTAILNFLIYIQNFNRPCTVNDLIHHLTEYQWASQCTESCIVVIRLSERRNRIALTV